MPYIDQDGKAVTGLIKDLAVDPGDPRHWLAVSSTGGVWETRNTGAKWRAISDDFAYLGFSCIAIAQSDPKRIYAGTGNFREDFGVYGAGVLKSLDGGET